MKHPAIYVGIMTIVISFGCQSIENQYEYYSQLAAYYEELVFQAADNIDLACDLGFIYKKLGKFLQAENVYTRALIINPNHARAHRALSHIQLGLGNFEQGWLNYEWRWIPVPSWAYEVKKHLEKYRTLQGTRLLLKTEYGFGDIFQFIRYAKIFKDLGAHIILECNPKLINILSLCPYLDEIIPAEQQLPPFDLQAFIMSGPLICSTTLNTIPCDVPYLYAHQDLINYWAPYFTAEEKIFNIGICWQADLHVNSNNTTVQDDAKEKSINLEYFAQLTQIPGIRLYSLQKNIDLTTQQKAQSLGIRIIDHFDEERGAFMDTAAIMMHMDLIISIDTSLAHLAGALGKSVLVMLPHIADWRWLLDRTNSPWYPTMKLLRQPNYGNCKEVLEMAVAEIERLCTRQ